MNTVGIGLFCWLIFTLAAYALPFSVAVSAGMMAFHSGAGIVGASLVGVGAGAATLAIGQTVFGAMRHLILRAAFAGVFAVPAAIAGYHVVLVMSQIGVHSLAWREVFASVGAILIGRTAWTRLAVFAEPQPLEPGGMVKNTPQPVLTAATREG